MSSIRVTRGDGTQVGDGIYVPLLSDDALLDRGKAEMDSTAQGIATVTLDVAYQEGMHLGDLVHYEDPAVGGVSIGKVVGIDIGFSHGLATLAITVEKPI